MEKLLQALIGALESVPRIADAMTKHAESQAIIAEHFSGETELNRRVVKILETMKECVDTSGDSHGGSDAGGGELCKIETPVDTGTADRDAEYKAMRSYLDARGVEVKKGSKFNTVKALYDKAKAEEEAASASAPDLPMEQEEAPAAPAEPVEEVKPVEEPSVGVEAFTKETARQYLVSKGFVVNADCPAYKAYKRALEKMGRSKFNELKDDEYGTLVKLFDEELANG